MEVWLWIYHLNRKHVCACVCCVRFKLDCGAKTTQQHKYNVSCIYLYIIYAFDGNRFCRACIVFTFEWDKQNCISFTHTHTPCMTHYAWIICVLYIPHTRTHVWNEMKCKTKKIRIQFKTMSIHLLFTFIYTHTHAHTSIYLYGSVSPMYNVCCRTRWNIFSKFSMFCVFVWFSFSIFCSSSLE